MTTLSDPLTWELLHNFVLELTPEDHCVEYDRAEEVIRYGSHDQILDERHEDYGRYGPEVMCAHAMYYAAQYGRCDIVGMLHQLIDAGEFHPLVTLHERALAIAFMYDQFDALKAMVDCLSQLPRDVSEQSNLHARVRTLFRTFRCMDTPPSVQKERALRFLDARGWLPAGVVSDALHAAVVAEAVDDVAFYANGGLREVAGDHAEWGCDTLMAAVWNVPPSGRPPPAVKEILFCLMKCSSAGARTPGIGGFLRYCCMFNHDWALEIVLDEFPDRWPDDGLRGRDVVRAVRNMLGDGASAVSGPWLRDPARFDLGDPAWYEHRARLMSQRAERNELEFRGLGLSARPPDTMTMEYWRRFEPDIGGCRIYLDFFLTNTRPAYAHVDAVTRRDNGADDDGDGDGDRLFADDDDDGYRTNALITRGGQRRSMQHVAPARSVPPRPMPRRAAPPRRPPPRPVGRRPPAPPRQLAVPSRHHSVLLGIGALARTSDQPLSYDLSNTGPATVTMDIATLAAAAGAMPSPDHADSSLPITVASTPDGGWLILNGATRLTAMAKNGARTVQVVELDAQQLKQRVKYTQ